MKTLLRIAFFSLVLGISLSFNATVQAQETVNSTVDEMPVPPGGIAGLTNYMIQNLKYPTAARSYEMFVSGIELEVQPVTEEE